jgi:hypothetical protein
MAQAKSWTRLLGWCIMLPVPVELDAGDDDDPQVCPFPLLRIFKAPVDCEFWKEEDDQSTLQCSSISLRRCVLTCPSLVLPIVFLDINHI